MLWQYDNRCANQDCRCLLPDPNLVQGATVRAMMSFGTADTRVGFRGVRASISTNRDFAYNCLYHNTALFA
jgi:hypothetical protein